MSFKTINADDMGMNKQSDTCITELALSGKINSVSCFVVNNLPAPSQIQTLKEIPNLKIGLHLDLTEFANCTLTQLILKVVTGKLSQCEMEEKFRYQIKKFIELFERFPDHIDSHQHIHQLPIIRSAFVDAIKSFKHSESYVRNTDISLSFITRHLFTIGISSYCKNIYLKLLGVSFKRLATRSSLRTNRYLLGTYSFNSKLEFKKLIELFEKIGNHDHDIFYCHPGQSSDVISRNREVEYTTLKELT